MMPAGAPSLLDRWQVACGVVLVLLVAGAWDMVFKAGM